MPKFMRDNFKNIFSDKVIKFSILSSIIIFLINIVLIVFLFPKLPPFIPFFNSMPWGEDRLAPVNIVFYFVAVFLLVVIINTILSAVLYSKYTFLSRILSITSFLFVCMGFLSFLQIIFSVF